MNKIGQMFYLVYPVYSCEIIFACARFGGQCRYLKGHRARTMCCDFLLRIMQTDPAFDIGDALFQMHRKLAHALPGLSRIESGRWVIDHAFRIKINPVDIAFAESAVSIPDRSFAGILFPKGQGGFGEVMIHRDNSDAQHKNIGVVQLIQGADNHAISVHRVCVLDPIAADVKEPVRLVGRFEPEANPNRVIFVDKLKQAQPGVLALVHQNRIIH